MDINQTLLKIIFCVAIGALIGLEREKNKQSESTYGGVGIRTDILISIFGATSVILSQLFTPIIFYMSFTAILGVGGISFAANKFHGDAQNLKTVISSILVFLLSSLTMFGQIQVSLVIAIIITFVLSMKNILHNTIQKISYVEIIDGIKFLIIAFVVLPFLPNQNYDHQILGFIEKAPLQQEVSVQSSPANQNVSPEIAKQNKLPLSSPTTPSESNILNPYRIWLLIVIISGLDFLGYIMVKLFGNSKGYGLTGLIGGFYSSTITSLTLSTISKKQPTVKYPFIAGILLACASSFFKMFVLIKTINGDLFSKLLPDMALMLIYLLITGGLFHWYSQKTGKHAKVKPLKLQSPLQLLSAVRIAVIVIVTMILANVILQYSDLNYYYLLGGLMAFFLTDDPIIISTAGIAGSVISIDLGRQIILSVVFLNILQKVATAFFFGNRQLVKPLAITMFGLFLVTGLAFLYL